MNARVQRVREAVETPLLVTNVTNVRYLTGFRSSNAAVLVERDRLRLFADFRYADAGRHVEEVEFEVTKRAIPADLAGRLAGRIAFEAATLPYADYELLRAGGLELVPTRNVVERLRAVKDEQEIAAIRRATELTNVAFERFAGERVIGRTERELAWRMDSALHELGAQGNAFPTIVATGPNAANPHTTPGDRVVERGDTVIVDAGARLGGREDGVQVLTSFTKELVTLG
ncbi:MAG: M24 family metallopeptidase [Actinomycetota bacterium]|nr:M24 family metallopeptidase [Actinomycetota bacterium]